MNTYRLEIRRKSRRIVCGYFKGDSAESFITESIATMQRKRDNDYMYRNTRYCWLVNIDPKSHKTIKGSVPTKIRF